MNLHPEMTPPEGHLPGRVVIHIPLPTPDTQLTGEAKDREGSSPAPAGSAGSCRASLSHLLRLSILGPDLQLDCCFPLASF